MAEPCRGTRSDIAVVLLLLTRSVALTAVHRCGRVIGRLRRANYRVHLLIVLASYERCVERIEARRAQTTRGVPDAVLRGTLRDLQRAVPVYVAASASGEVESTWLFDNEDDPLGPPRLNDTEHALRRRQLARRTITAGALKPLQAEGEAADASADAGEGEGDGGGPALVARLTRYSTQEERDAVNSLARQRLETPAAPAPSAMR